jgi:hypothetical protein
MMTDIYSLHGTTVAEIFSSGLDNLEEIEAVAVVVTWKNGKVTAGASSTTNERLAFMAMVLDQHVRAGLFNNTALEQS